MVPTDKTIVEWDVPLLSVDFQATMAAIHQHAELLAHDLQYR